MQQYYVRFGEEVEWISEFFTKNAKWKKIGAWGLAITLPIIFAVCLKKVVFDDPSLGVQDAILRHAPLLVLGFLICLYSLGIYYFGVLRPASNPPKTFPVAGKPQGYYEPQTNAQHLAAILRQHRQAFGMTQEHLAKAAGLTARSVRRIEAEGQPSFESLRAICSVLEISAVTVLRDSQKSDQELSREQYDRKIFLRLYLKKALAPLKISRPSQGWSACAMMILLWLSSLVMAGLFYLVLGGEWHITMGGIIASLVGSFMMIQLFYGPLHMKFKTYLSGMIDTKGPLPDWSMTFHGPLFAFLPVLTGVSALVSLTGWVEMSFAYMVLAPVLTFVLFLYYTRFSYPPIEEKRDSVLRYKAFLAELTMPQNVGEVPEFLAHTERALQRLGSDHPEALDHVKGVQFLLDYTFQDHWPSQEAVFLLLRSAANRASLDIRAQMKGYEIFERHLRKFLKTPWLETK